MTHHWLPAWPEALLGSLPCASQGLYPAAGSVSFSSCAKGGRDGGTRRLSILQASADTQGRLIHCPNPPPIAAWKCLSRKISVSLHGQGKKAVPFSQARSACHVLGPKGPTPSNRIFHAITSFPFLQKNHPGPRPGRLLTS